MEFIQNSGDILNIVIAVSIALLVFFICWGLFYMVMVFRNISKITQDTRKGFSRVSEILTLVKEQVENGTFYFSLVSEALKKGVEFLKKKTGDSKSKNKTSPTPKRTAKKSSQKKTKKN
jgi:hypothetical protein